MIGFVMMSGLGGVQALPTQSTTQLTTYSHDYDCWLLAALVRRVLIQFTMGAG